ncbi:MAG: hypothetical protein ABIR31_09930, partial [Ginsengibacter sp.]
MKKQIKVLFAVFASLYLISCQKEAITAIEQSQNSTAFSANANQSKIDELGVPFKGSFTTSFVLIQPPPNLIQNVSGTGIASHLGKSKFESISNVAVRFPAPFRVSGTRTITAANGDQLFTTFTGTSTPVVNGMNGA